MISKQKISAIAKDINIPGKEIAKMLTEVAGITKSSAASATEISGENGTDTLPLISTPDAKTRYSYDVLPIMAILILFL